MVSCNDRVTPNGKENCEWKWKIFDISDAVLFLPVFIIKLKICYHDILNSWDIEKIIMF